MTVTLANARTEVRALLDEPNPQFWSNTQLNSWINQGAQDISRRAQALWMQATVAAVPEQQFYRLPDDFLGVHRIDYRINNSDQTYNLEFRGLKTMDEIWGILQQLPAAFPQAFYLWNDTGYAGGQPYFATYPVVGDNGTFIVYYYRNAIFATADAQYVDVTPAYEDLVYDYAVAKGKQADRDSTWQDHMANYRDALQMMFDKTSRFSDQGDQFTSGTPNWPLYLYTDTNNWF
jgi:hypothetical protein